MSASANHAVTPLGSRVASTQPEITCGGGEGKPTLCSKEIETTQALQLRQASLAADREPARLKVPICNGACCPLFQRRLCSATASSGELLQPLKGGRTSTLPALGNFSLPHPVLNRLAQIRR
jgi:hypothetical protein